MSKPIVTIALSDDGHSVFVYSGGIELATENGPLSYDRDTSEMIACIGRQNEDFVERVEIVVERLVRQALA